MKNYIRLARPHHWMKNALVLLPLICSGQFLELWRLRHALLGFLAFSFLASGIYVVNDIRDREKDRNSTAKCNRPIASGAISPARGGIFGGVLTVVAVALLCLSAKTNRTAWLAAGAYLILNLGYSFGLKKVPLVDIAILAAGFLLRLIFGGAVTGIVLSKWLCLTIIALSFFMGLGKRRGELKGQKGQTREVLKYYNQGFLDKNMYLCMGLGVVFYGLWTVDSMTIAHTGAENLIWTVPLVLLICMKYSLDVEGDSDGDPVEVLLHDKVLMAMGVLLGVINLVLLYGGV